jgi:hypothetical protein
VHPDKPTVDLRAGHELEAIAQIRRLMIDRAALLEALQAFSRVWEEGRKFADMDVEEIEALRSKARAAIAKATKP